MPNTYLIHATVCQAGRAARDGPAEILEGRRGLLQANAATVFDGLFVSVATAEVGCQAHTSRLNLPYPANRQGNPRNAAPPT